MPISDGERVSLLSAYSFRHQVSADLKAAGVEKNAIAQVLGHASERTQGRYGRPSRGQAGGGIILDAIGSRPVRTGRPAPDSNQPSLTADLGEGGFALPLEAFLRRDLLSPDFRDETDPVAIEEDGGVEEEQVCVFARCDEAFGDKLLDDTVIGRAVGAGRPCCMSVSEIARSLMNT